VNQELPGSRAGGLHARANFLIQERASSSRGLPAVPAIESPRFSRIVSISGPLLSGVRLRGAAPEDEHGDKQQPSPHRGSSEAGWRGAGYEAAQHSPS
jgi:hypothetical protein